MTERRYCPLERISRQYSVYFSRAERAEHAALHHLGEAEDGVERRPQLVAHVGEELGLRAVRALGLRLLLEVAFGEVGELLRLQLQRLARFLQVRHRGDELPFGIDELLLMALQGRDVRADRDVAAVLGAAFVDLQPAPVAELGLEGARPDRAAVAADEPMPDDGRLRAFHHRGVILARNHKLRREVVQGLEFRVAEHEPVVGVPQHEGFRDRVDRVAQARIGLRRVFGERPLVGDVDRDADEMLAGVVGIAHQLGPGAQPDPDSRRAADAEIVIDDRGFRRGEPVGEAVEVAVLAMDEAVDLAEGQELVATLVAEHLVHRVRPVDTAAGDVPIPQSTSPAAQRRVDPALDLVAHVVGGPRVARLKPVGAAKPDDHEHRRGKQRDLAERPHAPVGEQSLREMDDGDLALRARQSAHGRKRRRIVSEPDRHDAGAVAEKRERLSLAEDFAQQARSGACRRMSREDLAGGAGDEEHAAVRERACRKRARERREARFRRGAVAGAAERQRRERRDDLDLRGGAGERVPAAVADLKIAADAERDEEEAEEGRNREAKPGLGPLEAEARRRRARHS